MTDKRRETEILNERAEAMAAVMSGNAGDAGGTQFLELELAGERYAVELPLVREVCSGRRITRIPGSRTFMAGVANIRGQILPVADLALFFGIRAETPEEREMIILRARSEEGTAAEGGPRELCILADSVLGVRDLSPAAIQPPPHGFAGVHGRYLRGVTPDGLILFRAEKFLEDTCTAAGTYGAEAKKNWREQ